MRRVISLIITIGIVLIALAAFIAIQVLFPNPASIQAPGSEQYLTFYPTHLTNGGDETRVFLLSSQAMYGSYNQTFHNLAGDVTKGDPCVIINVTVRNDYTEEKRDGYFISFTARLYDREGKRVGKVMTLPGLLGSLHGSFVEVQLENGEIRTFNIYVAYEKKDVYHYELYVFNVQDLPTP